MNNIVLSIKNINKKFGNTTALTDFDLDINEGEFVTILGPSGCGKTTLLRIIAGLETPDTGSVILDNVDISNYPPEKRNINTIFQNYALFPHMNVYDNIAYGLKINRYSKQDIKKKVYNALELVQLVGCEKRKIHQLSGGQKQRVAIARALVLEPKVLLLDEPLGALDRKLRLSMQDELKKMQIASGTTFLYITHDQEEALNLSDKIVLMNNSKIEQIGNPFDIYNYPKNLFASEFIGVSNILKGIPDTENISFELFSVRVDAVDRIPAYAVVRPENIIPSESGVSAIVIKQSINGGIIVTELKLRSNKKIIMHGFDTPLLSVGDSINIAVKNDIHYVYE